VQRKEENKVGDKGGILNKEPRMFGVQLLVLRLSPLASDTDGVCFFL